MSKRRSVILSVVLEGRTQAQTARLYGVSEGWVFKLVARWRAEGDAAFQARSRRPGSSPSKVCDETVELVVNLRSEHSDVQPQPPPTTASPKPNGGDPICGWTLSSTCRRQRGAGVGAVGWACSAYGFYGTRDRPRLDWTPVPSPAHGNIEHPPGPYPQDQQTQTSIRTHQA